MNASGQVYANYRWPNCESRLVEFGQVELDYRFTLAGVAELADAIDSKSIVRKGVMVRVHSPVLIVYKSQPKQRILFWLAFILCLFSYVNLGVFSQIRFASNALTSEKPRPVTHYGKSLHRTG